MWYDIDWHLKWVHDQTPCKIKILLKIGNLNVELDRNVLYFAFYNLPIIKSFLFIYMAMYLLYQKKHLEILLVILVIHIIYAGSRLSRQAYQHFLSHLRLRVIPCSHSTAVLRFWFFIQLLYKWRTCKKESMASCKKLSMYFYSTTEPQNGYVVPFRYISTSTYIFRIDA